MRPAGMLPAARRVNARPIARRASIAALAAFAGLALLPACNSMNGPEVISISSAEYPHVFEACLDQARDVGMPAVLADRSIGVIETKPRHIGSLVEPWRQDSTGVGQGAEATIQYERRRVRFEFVPAGFTLPAPSGEQRLTGPLVPGSIQDERRFDLEHYQGEIELRAWVYVERAFTPGLKPGQWSLSLTTTWTDPITNNPYRESTDTTTRSPTTWTPISRDEAMERTLLARVQKQLDQPANGSNGAGESNGTNGAGEPNGAGESNNKNGSAPAPNGSAQAPTPPTAAPSAAPAG